MKSKSISTQTAAFHIGHSGTVLQKHFDVSVIIASVLRPTLKRTLHSIFRQDFSGQIHILIDSLKCDSASRLWYLPLKGDKTGMSTDRSVFSYLRENTRYRSTNLATCFYAINPMDGMHKQRLKWINESR